MPLKPSKNVGTVFRFFLLASLVLSILPALPSAQAENAKEPAYIVKYRASCAHFMGDCKVPFDVVNEAELQKLLEADALEWYEPDGDAMLFDEPQANRMDADDPYYTEDKWDLCMIGADAAFCRGFLGQGVRIGVLDSGVNLHPDLTACLLPGHNYMEDAQNPDDTTDGYGHGTKVAGLIAGAGENGYIGAAPMAELVPLKCTDGKTVKVSAICRAIYGGIDDYHCDILNMSLGLTTEYASLKEAIAYAAEKHVIVVSAVGNSGTASQYYPAKYETVIGVGAVDENGNWYSHSNHNDSVFLTAPGVNVKSTAHRGGYTTGTGTSFSVPQVTAAAAIMLCIDDTLTPDEAMQLLSETASDKGEPGFDAYYGYGIVNIAGMIHALDAGAHNETADVCTFLPSEGAATAIRNNTDASLDCTYLLAQYDEEGRCLGVKTYQLTIPPQATSAIEPPDDTHRFGQFLYETQTMIPLAKERKKP